MLLAAGGDAHPAYAIDVITEGHWKLFAPTVPTDGLPVLELAAPAPFATPASPPSSTAPGYPDTTAWRAAHEDFFRSDIVTDFLGHTPDLTDDTPVLTQRFILIGRA